MAVSRFEHRTVLFKNHSDFILWSSLWSTQEASTDSTAWTSCSAYKVRRIGVKHRWGGFNSKVSMQRFQPGNLNPRNEWKHLYINSFTYCSVSSLCPQEAFPAGVSWWYLRRKRCAVMHRNCVSQFLRKCGWRWLSGSLCSPPSPPPWLWT